MATTSSEYNFPIFISSTDYNLIDLRAELANYLSELGYKPILSSSDGFPDSSPDYAPWESCLQVLQSAYVMVLIIDDKYGAKFEWPNFKEIIGDAKVSPTHAEYLFAHRTKKRMLVFIRSTMLAHYQSYRSALDIAGGNKEIARENLSKVLPKHIRFETLEFIEEVKKTEPIPWIKAFENVTDIKKEIQRKLLNELAELFLFKSKHMEAVIREFSKAIDDLPEDKRREILNKVGATKELIEKSEIQTKAIQELKKSEELLSSKLKATTDQLEKAKDEKSAVKIKFEKEILFLRKELKGIKSKIGVHENVNADYIVSGSTAASGSILSQPIYINGLNSISSSLIGGRYDTVLNPMTVDFWQGATVLSKTKPKCEKCQVEQANSLISPPLHQCKECKKNLCQSCFAGSNISGQFFTECVECREKKSQSTFIKK
jgi:hypothetical protein